MLTHIYSLIGLFEGFCSLERCYKDAYICVIDYNASNVCWYVAIRLFNDATVDSMPFLKHYSITS